MKTKKELALIALDLSLYGQIQGQAEADQTIKVLESLLFFEAIKEEWRPIVESILRRKEFNNEA